MQNGDKNLICKMIPFLNCKIIPFKKGFLNFIITRLGFS